MARPSTSLDLIVDAYCEGRISRREFVRRGVGLGLSLPALGGLLAACAGDEEGAGPTETGPGRPGGVLREGYDLDFSRMDPINTNWYDPGFWALYDRMLSNDPDGNLTPMIAESWELSPDATTATFKIRPGLKFHSGDPLDADAIKAVYDTIADPNSGSPLVPLWGPVESTEAPDPTTLVIRCKHPYFDILNVVETGYWSIVNIKARERLGEDYGKQEIDGSGPFTFGEWVPGSHVTVNRWEAYPGSMVPYFENKEKAYLDGIRWVAILEAAQRAIQIEGGEIDTLHAPAFQDVERLEANDDLTVIKLKEWSGYFVGLNWEREDLEFADLRVRQAVSHAINRQAIVDGIFFGQGEPLYGPITSADFAYNPEVESYNQFDLDKAKQLMADAGWTPGQGGILEKNGVRQRFKMTIQAESFNQQIATAIQAQLKELGMEVDVQAFDRGTYFNRLFGGKEDSFIFFYLWPVPVDVHLLFVKSGFAGNWGHANVPEVDAAIEAWQTAANRDELVAGGQQFHLAVAEHVPVVPVVNRNNVWVHRKNVHGWLPHQWNLYPYYNDVWLEA